MDESNVQLDDDKVTTPVKTKPKNNNKEAAPKETGKNDCALSGKGKQVIAHIQ